MKLKKLPPLKPLFLERMQQLLPDKKDFKNYLNILKILPVRSIRCNTLKISPKELKERLEKKAWKVSQPWENHPEIMIIEGKIAHSPTGSLGMKTVNTKLITPRLDNSSVNKSSVESLGTSLAWNNQSANHSEPKLIDLEPGELGRSLEHLLGYYYIQELASMLPVIALKPKPNETILDLCSAPGSKTTQLAAEMKNTGTIIANEVSLGRIKILASNLERCGVTNTIITRKEGIAFCKRLKKQNFLFDRILVDAPCSGEGTLRSSPKTYLMWNIKTIKAVSRLQKNLIAVALEILKPNGELVYSTCTHAPEENEEVIDYILKEFKNIKVETIKLPINCRPGISCWNDKDYNPNVKYSCRIYPQDNNTEGFFLAKLRRVK